MIEQFTKQEFEEVLSPLDTTCNEVNGEYEYQICGPHSRIKIRSSIDTLTGIARSTGEDSIRLWLEVKMSDGKYKPLKKLDSYTTRTKGWNKRFAKKLAQFLPFVSDDEIVMDAPVCPDCGNGWPAISKTQKNPDRLFISCGDHNHFAWLDGKDANRGVQLIAPTKSVERDDSGDLLFAVDAPPPVSVVTSPLDELFEEIEETPLPERPKFELSDQQSAIVNHDPSIPARVLATAGSGKTATMEQYIARLVKEGAKPGSILYVTFNKSMADSGSERIIRTLTEAGINGEDARQFGQWFCTIHAACYRMLRDNGLKAQVAKNWEIKKALQDIIPEIWPYEEDSPNPKSLYTAICNAKHHYYGPDSDIELFVNLFGEYHGRKASEARKKFDRTMRNDGKITFQDMLYLAECALDDDPSFRRKWQSRFEHIIVDEGQDTNVQAMRILTLLATPQNQFTIVGDSDQMMYRFAGASPEFNLLDGFSERFPNGELFKIDTNYRSLPSIVNAGANLIKHNYNDFGGKIEAVFRKAINPFSKTGGTYVHFEMYDDIHEESLSVAKDIKSKLDSNDCLPGDIFVGARTRAQLGNLEPLFTKMKIPFVNITGGSFWHLRHMRIAVAYLKLLQDPTDKSAFNRVYNVASSDMRVPWRNHENYGRYSSTRFLGKKFVSHYDGIYQNLHNDRYPPTRWIEGALDFTKLMDSMKIELNSGGIAEAVQLLITDCMTDWLNEEDDLSGDDDSRKIDDLWTLHDLAVKFGSLDELLSYIQACIDAAESAKMGELDKYVVLSTYHRLKGLERDYVYGLGWCEGNHVLTGEPMGLLPHTYALRPPTKNDPLDLSEQTSIADERCIGFVALTRARKRVYLSGIENHRNGVMRPSRFVHEAGLI